MTRFGQLTCTVLAAGILLSVGACSTEKDSGKASSSGDSTVSCARQFTYQGRTYQQVANRKFTVGESLGSVKQRPCSDTGRDDGKSRAPVSRAAFEVKGISTSKAIAVGDTTQNAELYAVYSGGQPPEDLLKLTDGS
ncbi:hypothetical protein CJD44_33995 [Streptomyces sp. alain-838]|uniref:DUF6281 family protein n=1 Tax=Streptomyces TaxID=1883 RepID=UPI000BCDFB56|nr:MULTISPECIES: DUF6281 family protein [unclassified Streptomyces]MDN3258156.1 DUF6281 family protein [Streptomyces sp. MA25(2023)]PAK22653.1 hypothetical protein CJD44_33995 [Streptomyces sp. alain-838]